MTREIAEPRIIEAGGLNVWCRPDTSDDIVAWDNLDKHSYEKRGITIEAGDRWLDLGGYIGTFALRVLMQGGHVLSFEPFLESFLLLTKNQQENELNGFSVPAAVVQDRVAPYVPLYINERKGNFASNTLHPHWKREKPSRMVPAISFAEAVEMYETLLPPTGRRCLKMDTEGAEIPVLENMAKNGVGGWAQLTCEYHFSVDPSVTKLRGIMDALGGQGFTAATDRKLPDKKLWDWPRKQTVQLYARRD